MSNQRYLSARTQNWSHSASWPFCYSWSINFSEPPKGYRVPSYTTNFTLLYNNLTIAQGRNIILENVGISIYWEDCYRGCRLTHSRRRCDKPYILGRRFHWCVFIEWPHRTRARRSIIFPSLYRITSRYGWTKTGHHEFIYKGTRRKLLGSRFDRSSIQNV